MMLLKGFRHDTGDLFKLCGNFEGGKLKHHPFVMVCEGTIELCDSVSEMETYPPDTQVLTQWGGQWRSDFFEFKVSDWLAHKAIYPRGV